MAGAKAKRSRGEPERRAVSDNNRTRRKALKRTPEEREQNTFLGHAASFLVGRGWDVLVIGGIRIQQPRLDRPNSLEFVIDFLGVPPKKPPTT